MSLKEQHLAAGATLAPDGIPLQYGDLGREYQAALEGVVLMDRSHEGRLELYGRDRFALMQRMSTNDVLNMAANEGRPTVFTNPNGRILDRVMVYNRDTAALLLGEPGRGEPLRTYLQQNIFFNDDVRVVDVTPTTHLLVLHGPQADAVMENLHPRSADAPPLSAIEFSINGVQVFAARRKPLHGQHWAMVVNREQAETVWAAVVESGQPHSLTLAGSLTYNVLRIASGRPGVMRELSTDYIPLEVGLWDEVSFSKGCYTGQEIIARMESRNRLAKTLVALRLDQPVDAPAPLHHEGKPAGTLTSSVTTPDGQHLGLGFVKLALASVGQELAAGEAAAPAHITALPGAQPPTLDP